MKILIAEDDLNLRRGLTELLQLEGFDVVSAECGLDAITVFQDEEPDFCILDVSMPGMDGFEVCKELRRTNQDVPILFLTARNEEIDRVLGLGLGADDYMGKPFGSRELVSRIRAICRRASPAQPPSSTDASFVMNDLTIDVRALRAYRNGTAIALSPRELAVLELLYKQKGYVVTRDMLYNQCWGQDHFSNSRALDQFISALRRKIELNSASPRIIKTVRGAGYRFEPET